MLSKRWNCFLILICSAWDVHVKTVNILQLAVHAWKFVWLRLSVQWNRFLVCSVCDKMVSTSDLHAHALLSKITQKYQIKMQISTIINQNFKKKILEPIYCIGPKWTFWRKKFLLAKKIWFRLCSVTGEMFEHRNSGKNQILFEN